MSPHLLASLQERRKVLLPGLFKIGAVFLIVCFVFAAFAFPVKAAVPYPATFADPAKNCGGSTPCFDKLQDAIDNVAVGGTVTVYGGTYTDSLVTLATDATVNCLADVTINGSFEQTAGTFNAPLNGTLTLTGSFKQTNGLFNHRNGTLKLSSSDALISAKDGLNNLTTATGNPDLIGYWKFDEGSGTSVSDATGNGNNGVISYANTPPVYVDGQSDQYKKALSFTPSNMQYVTIGTKPSMRPTQYTLALWFNWMDPGSSNVYVLTGKKTDEYEIRTGSAGVNSLRFIPAGAGTEIDTGNVLQAGWNHIVATYGGGTAAIYVNGVLAKSASVTATATLSNDYYPLYLGMRSDFTYSMNGYLDDVRFYQRAMTASEVANLFSGSCLNATCLNGPVTVNGKLALNGVLSLGDYNLTLGPTASITGEFSPANMIVADGAGSLVKQYNSDTLFTFPVGDSFGKYTPATIDLDNGTYDAGASLAVRVVRGRHPSLSGSVTNYIARYWVVKATGISGTGFEADVNFTYADSDVTGTESLMKGLKYNGSSWANYGMLLPAANTMIGTVASFSDFTAASGQATAVSMGGFSAESAADGVLLSWQGGVETGLAGFNLYRADSPDSEPVQLNTALIPVGQPGGLYTYVDASIVPGQTYTYWVELVDLHNQTTRSTPVSAGFWFRTFLPTTFRK